MIITTNTAIGRMVSIARPTTVEAGGIDRAMMITGLAGIVDGAIMTEMTIIAPTIPNSLITTRGGRASSTAKNEGKTNLPILLR
jgi:hypothetical protein